MDAFTLVGKLTLDSQGFMSDLDYFTSGSNAQSMIAKGSAIGNLISSGIKSAMRGAVDFAKSAIETSMNFDQAMQEVRSIREAGGGITDAEFNALREKALELGRTTKFTAEEVANAFYYEAIAGWSVEKMLNGVEASLNLAAASGEDLASTSDIITDALTAFGLTAKDSGHFVDVLAAAASSSNTNVHMMGEAFKYIAPLAGSLKYSVDDVAAALGIMANSGIKSSMAGTSLRMILSNMIDPSKDAAKALKDLGISLDDDTGKMKPFRQVMEELRQTYKENDFNPTEGRSIEEIAAAEEKYAQAVEKTQAALDNKEITQKQYDKLMASHQQELADYIGFNAKFLGQLSAIAGLRGISGLLAIMKSSDEEFEQVTKAIENSAGAADKMSATMLDSLKGDITLLNDAIDGLKISLTDTFNTELRGFIQGLTENVGQLNHIIKYGFFGDSGIIDLENGIANAEQKGDESITEAQKNALKAKSLYDQLAEMSKTLGETGEGLKEWQGAAQDLINLCPSLADKIDLVNGKFTADKEAIYADIEAMEARAKAMALQQVLSDKMAALVKAESEEINRRVDVMNKQAEFDAAMKPAMDRANELMKKYGLEYEAYDSSTGTYAMKNTVSTFEELQQAMARLSVSPMITDEEWGNFNQLEENAEKANKALESAKTSQENLSSSLANAQSEYASYAAAVQGMINELTGMKQAIDSIPESKDVDININYHTNGDGSAVDGSHAKGDWNIPYDNYIARLHRGEMVLTATQARQYRNNESSGGGASAAEIGREMSRAMRGVGFYFNDREVARTFGNSTTGRVNRNIVQANRRHHAGYGG